MSTFDVPPMYSFLVLSFLVTTMESRLVVISVPDNTAISSHVVYFVDEYDQSLAYPYTGGQGDYDYGYYDEYGRYRDEYGRYYDQYGRYYGTYDSTFHESRRPESENENTTEDIIHRETSGQESARKVCEGNNSLDDVTCDHRGSFSQIRYDAPEAQYYGDGRSVGIAHGNREDTNGGSMLTTKSMYDLDAKVPCRTSSNADATWTSNRSSPDETRPIVDRARSASNVVVPATLGSEGELRR